MELAFPFRINGTGRTFENSDDHIRDLIEQVLFTTPGERLNRPDFGTSLMDLLFDPAGDEMLAATQFLVQGALQQWLGDLIEVEAIRVDREDTTLHVWVQYVVIRSKERHVAEFSPA